MRSIHLLAGGLAVLLLWAPLPFASIRQQHQVVLFVAAFGALALAAWAAPRASELGPHALLPSAALASVAGIGALQLWLPPSGALATWQSLSSSLLLHPLPLPSGRAFNHEAVVWSALGWLAAAALLLAAATAGRHRAARRALGAALVAGGLFQVLFGAHHWARRSATIWGREVPNAADRLRGTFVNPDHCATFLLLSLAVTFAWGWWALRRARQTEAPERKLLLVAPAALAWWLLFAGLAFTGSRSALAATLVGTALQGVLAAVAQRRWPVSVAGLLAAAVGLGFVAVVGLQEGLGRWLATSPFELAWNIRLTVYRATFQLWQQAPWLGFGLGSFRDAFPLASPPGLEAQFWDAHNQYLELLVTGGLAALALVATAAAAVVARLARVLRAGSRSEDRGAALAALGAAAAVAVHSFFDFGLSMPANAFALVILLGAAVGAKTARQG